MNIVITLIAALSFYISTKIIILKHPCKVGKGMHKREGTKLECHSIQWFLRIVMSFLLWIIFSLIVTSVL